jgi:hypothetical protein
MSVGKVCNKQHNTETASGYLRVRWVGGQGWIVCIGGLVFIATVIEYSCQ